MQKVKPALLRGFDQEYLPQDQLQFNRLIELIRRNFERYGFLPIETPSAERREVLTSKGGVEKEIYALTRLAEADDDEAATKGARIAEEFQALVEDYVRQKYGKKIPIKAL